MNKIFEPEENDAACRGGSLKKGVKVVDVFPKSFEKKIFPKENLYETT